MQMVEWRLNNKHNSTTISLNVKNSKIITVGKHSYGEIITESFENKSEQLSIGNFVSIASNVVFILGGNHKINTFTTYPLKAHFLEDFSEDDAGTKGPIKVEDEVWIGNNVLVLSGVTLGKGSIIAAGSVVTKDVMPFSIVGGNPAKFIKWRISENLIQERVAIDLEKIGLEAILKNVELFYTPLDQYIINLIKKDI
ncbi:hypothetical protein BKM63_03080 [Flavobacterium johnsoniae]|uniref:Uncharacterized protein n=2 Tax=Flavobacterium johnsoniae TaxID=986 RepID=A0A1J7BYC3_FLAJO|nr:hypothetical protein BKM63_03080 [Flavobacterium johnsoniae]